MDLDRKGRFDQRKGRFLAGGRMSRTAFLRRELQCQGIKKRGSLARSYLGVKQEEEQR